MILIAVEEKKVLKIIMKRETHSRAMANCLTKDTGGNETFPDNFMLSPFLLEVVSSPWKVYKT